MIKRLKNVWNIIWTTAKHWLADDAQRMGAALAYYGVLALPAILMTILYVIGIFYKSPDTKSKVTTMLNSLMGEKSNDFLQQLITNNKFHGKGIVATAIAVVVVILSVTGVFAELQSDLNSMWGLEQKPDLGWLRMLFNRVLLFLMLIGIGILLVLSLLTTTALTSVHGSGAASLPGGKQLWHVVEFIVSCGITTVLFAMIFKFLPNARTHWRDIFVGALVTAFLFNIGKLVLGVYLGSGSVSSAFGVAGSIVVTLVWVFYSAQIFLYGAEFTQIYASTHGRAIKPSKEAMWKAKGEGAREDREEANTSGKPQKTDWTPPKEAQATNKGHISDDTRPRKSPKQKEHQPENAEDTVHDIADRVHGWQSLRRKKS